MNSVLLDNTRDVPVTTDMLAFMQAAYTAIEKLCGLGGDNYILTGCTVTGTSASAGWMVLSGKLMPFAGGSVQANVRIVRTEEVYIVDGWSETEIIYHAEFGTSTTPADNVPWGSIKRLERGAVQVGREVRMMLRGRSLLANGSMAESLRVEGCVYTSTGDSPANYKLNVSKGSVYIPSLDVVYDVPEHNFSPYGTPALPFRWKVTTDANGYQYATLAQRQLTEPKTYADNENRF